MALRSKIDRDEIKLMRKMLQKKEIRDEKIKSNSFNDKLVKQVEHNYDQADKYLARAEVSLRQLERYERSKLKHKYVRHDE